MMRLYCYPERPRYNSLIGEIYDMNSATPNMHDLLAINTALADESRLRILAALRHGELCVCQIIALIDLAPSTISKHLALLRSARLIDARKEGRWMHYRLAGADATPVVRQALEFAVAALAALPQVAADDARLRDICRVDMVALCAAQRKGETLCCPPTGSD